MIRKTHHSVRVDFGFGVGVSVGFGLVVSLLLGVGVSVGFRLGFRVGSAVPSGLKKIQYTAKAIPPRKSSMPNIIGPESPVFASAGCAG